MNWRGRETDSAKKERVRIVIKIEIGTEKGIGIGRETGTDDVPDHPSELQNVDAAAAGRDGGVAAPAVRKETRGRIEKKRGREMASVVARKTENTTKIEGTERERGNGRRTRGAKMWMRGDTKRKRKIENTEKKRGANVRGAKAKTGSTDRSDLARNALALAVGPNRKQEKRETGSGNTAIARNSHTSAVVAKSARTVVNPATAEKT